MKTHRVRFYLFLFVIIQLWTQSCYYDHEQDLYHLRIVDCKTVSASFTTNVQPILSSYCATPSCHNSTGAGGVVLQTYDQVKSKLDRVNQRVLSDKTMPPNGALTTSELNIIQCWISGGGLNN